MLIVLLDCIELFFFIFWALCETNFVKILFVRLEVGTNKVQNSSSWEDFFLPLFNCSKMLTGHRNCISMLCKLVLLLIQKNFKIVLHKWKKCTLNQMKTVWQSKKSSKSVGSLFNQFNAFWALSYILINILALFLYMTTTNGFYKGVCFGLFISKNEF